MDVVVTGVTRGCGRALAVALARQGHRVHGCGRGAKGLATLAAELGSEHTFEALDVVEAPAVQAWADRIVARHGSPHLVINNAGLINTNAPLWRVPTEEFEAVVDVNVKGTAWVMRAFLPALIEAGRGVIANFSSGWGRSTAPEVAPYCATKWAVEGLSQAVAQEVPPGLSVVAVNPGIIHTEMLESCFGASANQHDDPESWARRAVPFLLALGPEHSGRQVSVP